MSSYFESYQELMKTRTPFIEVIQVDCRGSTPTDVGAKALITKNGLVAGTVGGGKVEAKAIAHGLDMLSGSSKPTDFLVWNLQKDVGMTCGGEVKLFFQAHFVDTWEIAVFGAGHVAQKLVRLLRKLDCQVYCIDSRSEWLEKIPDSENIKIIRLEKPSDFVSKLNSKCSIIVMTQGHSSDVPILAEVFRRDPFKFVGVIGSYSKSLVIKKELSELGVSESKLNQLQCPIGLPIGNSSPYEIAIGIVAQLLMVRDGQTFQDKKWKKALSQESLNF